ncbi:MAG TPA: DUF4173 domain-containing protein [Anaerolineaceae bacterium]|nr:DUF4173 domain-containing protein [Anaerolineaceae bacterium]
MPKKQKWFWLAALVAAWLFDFLFWSKGSGISFFIWTAVLLLAGYMLAWSEGKRPHALSVLLTLLILAFSTVMALRNEPLTRAVSVLLTLTGMMLLTATFLNGHWVWYRLRDYVVEFARVIGVGFSGAALLLAKGRTPPPVEGAPARRGWSRAWPIIRGVLIALPIVAIFGMLLASADQIFADWVKRIFNIEKLPEYLFRLFYILVIAGFLVGVYLKAILPVKDAQKPDPHQPWFKPFLGWTEGGIVLGAVNLLFIVFVIIQVRYLFGGDANITETGFTYAEYARRGFGELVAVAVLSLGLYLLLGTITRISPKGAAGGFTVLSVLLMANVLVILASSYQRLLLYENAYGFSRLRTYTHIFIYWLAGLILVTILLELVKRRGRFALSLLVAVVGFGATMAFINIDGFIVQRNVARAEAGGELDVAHLTTLSADAVPQLLRHYQEPELTAEVKDRLGSTLACMEKVTNDPADLPWQEFNFSQGRAYRLLQDNAGGWSQFKPYQVHQEWMIRLNGEEISCSNFVID